MVRPWILLSRAERISVGQADFDVNQRNWARFIVIGNDQKRRLALLFEPSLRGATLAGIAGPKRTEHNQG
jgi:hypothetical protein